MLARTMRDRLLGAGRPTEALGTLRTRTAMGTETVLAPLPTLGTMALETTTAALVAEAAGATPSVTVLATEAVGFLLTAHRSRRDHRMRPGGGG